MTVRSANSDKPKIFQYRKKRKKEQTTRPDLRAERVKRPLPNVAMPRYLYLIPLLPTLASFTALAQSPHELIVPGFSCSAGTHALVLPQSLKALRGMAKLKTEKAPRKGEGWENYRVLQFHQLQVGISINARKDAYVLEQADINGSQWLVARPLRVGASAVKVLGSLGLKEVPHGTWKLWGPGPDVALVKVEDDLITHISYRCYAG